MANGTTEVERRNALLQAEALQHAIVTSPNFAIIATDANGIIQLFNVGAERMLGYSVVEVVNKISPSDIHDPQEVVARAQKLSLEFAIAIEPGFEALAYSEQAQCFPNCIKGRNRSLRALISAEKPYLRLREVSSDPKCDLCLTNRGFATT